MILCKAHASAHAQPSIYGWQSVAPESTCCCWCVNFFQYTLPIKKKNGEYSENNSSGEPLLPWVCFMHLFMLFDTNELLLNRDKGVCDRFNAFSHSLFISATDKQTEWEQSKDKRPDPIQSVLLDCNNKNEDDINIQLNCINKFSYNLLGFYSFSLFVPPFFSLCSCQRLWFLFLCTAFSLCISCIRCC